MEQAGIVEIRDGAAWTPVGSLRRSGAMVAFLDAGPGVDVLEIELLPADSPAQRALRRWAYALMATASAGEIRVVAAGAVRESWLLAPLSLEPAPGGGVVLRGKRLR